MWKCPAPLLRQSYGCPTFKENFATLVPFQVHPAVPDVPTPASRQHHPFRMSFRRQELVVLPSTLRGRQSTCSVPAIARLWHLLSCVLSDQQNSHRARWSVHPPPRRRPPVAEAIGAQLKLSQPLPHPTCDQFPYLSVTSCDSLPDGIPWLGSMLSSTWQDRPKVPRTGPPPMRDRNWWINISISSLHR